MKCNMPTLAGKLDGKNPLGDVNLAGKFMFSLSSLLSPLQSGAQG
jgi:hypothetical protein